VWLSDQDSNHSMHFICIRKLRHARKSGVLRPGILYQGSEPAVVRSRFTEEVRADFGRDAPVRQNNRLLIFSGTFRDSKPARFLSASIGRLGISLDFQRQRHHVKLPTLMWMLTFWPRDERSPFSFLACNLISFDCPGHAGRRLKIPLPPRRISRFAPRLKERPTID
jgi:hypothetical protein